MSYATIAGDRIRYEVHGDGTPVVFLHGFPLSGRLWRHCIEPLRKRRRLIIPDVRGLGESAGHAFATMSRYADDVADLLNALGETEPVVVVGLSMGGYIAFEFMRRHADRVRGLVLADTRANADPPQKAEERRQQAARVMAEGTRVVVDAMMPALFGPAASESLKEEWRGIMNASPPEGVAAALKAMADRPDSTPTLATIRVPTLVIVGDQDTLTPPEVSRAMHQALPDSTLIIVPGSGHMLPVEKPQEFNHHLAAFLDRLRQSD